MAILPKKVMTEVGRTYQKEYGLRPLFVDLSGKPMSGEDPLAVLSSIRRRRDYALQESINLGEPWVFQPVPLISTWVVALEQRRMIHGGLIGGPVVLKSEPESAGTTVDYLVSHGIQAAQAKNFVGSLQVWPETRIKEAAAFLHDTFYQISGWKPDLMQENRLRALQQKQINDAIDDLRKSGKQALYAFEKERVLLASIRAGDRTGARRILNEMLAAIYMSSPQLVVLRARTVELMSCLTRAAIEDNPLLEPLIEQNHAWTERLVKAHNFEELSQVLMQALDDFIEGIYLHGTNRSNPKVSKALDFIGRNFTRKISLKNVAGEIGLSPCRVSHLVKEFTGKTVLQIIQQVRIQHARQLLEKTSLSSAQIAYDVGFGEQSYFIRHFRRLTGTTPARYRRTRQKPVA